MLLVWNLSSSRPHEFSDFFGAFHACRSLSPAKSALRLNATRSISSKCFSGFYRAHCTSGGRPTDFCIQDPETVEGQTSNLYIYQFLWSSQIFSRFCAISQYSGLVPITHFTDIVIARHLGRLQNFDYCQTTPVQYSALVDWKQIAIMGRPILSGSHTRSWISVDIHDDAPSPLQALHIDREG